MRYYSILYLNSVCDSLRGCAESRERSCTQAMVQLALERCTRTSMARSLWFDFHFMASIVTTLLVQWACFRESFSGWVCGCPKNRCALTPPRRALRHHGAPRGFTVAEVQRLVELPLPRQSVAAAALVAPGATRAPEVHGAVGAGTQRVEGAIEEQRRPSLLCRLSHRAFSRPRERARSCLASAAATSLRSSATSSSSAMSSSRTRRRRRMHAPRHRRLGALSSVRRMGRLPSFSAGFEFVPLAIE